MEVPIRNCEIKKYTLSELKEIILKLSNNYSQPMIGLILRDIYGIGSIKKEYNRKGVGEDMLQ